MSPIRQGRVIILLLLLSVVSSYEEAQVYYSRGGYGKNWDNVDGHSGQGRRYGQREDHRVRTYGHSGPSHRTTNAVRSMPQECQEKLFKRVMSENNIEVNDRAPNKAKKQVPRLIAAIAENVAGPFLDGLSPGMGSLVGSLISGGLDALMNVFGGEPDEGPPPNMPPVITCPKSITRFQEPGTKSARVTWDDPVAYDVEDGRLTNIEQTGGSDPGGRFSGEDIIKYRVKDSEGRKDTCSFYVTVRLIKCPPIPLRPHLKTNCSYGSYLGDVCRVSCDVGHTLSGASHLKCMENKEYDERFPKCKVDTCTEPALPPGGKSWDCSDSYNFESVCSLNCKEGYRIVSASRAPWNVASIECKVNSIWTHMPKCKDISAPTIENCPGFTMKYADRGKNSTVVTWPEIIGIDRSGGNVTVVQTIGLPSGSTFEVGAHEIAFEVTDDVQLKDTCVFYVNVQMRSCNAPMLTHRKLDINCNGRFYHGSACTVSCIQGIELQGSSRITCEVVNDDMTWSMPGGTPTCLEKVCAKLDHPPNARRDCSQYAGGTICYVKCLRNYIPARNAKGFATSTCSPATGIWRNKYHPGCVRKRAPSSLQSNLRFFWKLRVRCDETDTKNVTSEFNEILSRRQFLVKCPQCRVENVRSSCTERRKSRRPTYWLMTVRWSVVHDLDEGSSSEVLSTDIRGVGVRMKDWLQTKFKVLPVVGAGKGVPFRFRGSADTISCAAKYGSDQAEKTCAACALGYEFDGEEGCRMCPTGTYQDDSGDLKCKPCTEGRQTTGPGKTRAIDCKAPCPKGTSSSSGLTPCRDCPIGTYQSKKRSSKCEPCPEGFITATTASDNATDCYVPASPVNRMRVLTKADTFIKLRWMRPRELHGDLLGYDIAYYNASEDVRSRVFLNMQDNTTYSKVITGLEPVTEYVFTVWAVTEKGRGIENSMTVSTLNATEVTTTPIAPIMTDSTLCPPGTNSPNGRRYEDGTCTPCSKNFYQNETGQTSCMVCGPGLVTWYEGSTSETDCVDSTWTTPTTTTTTTTAPTTTTGPLEPCEPGHVSRSGFKPGCTQCPINKTPNKRRKRCRWCPKKKGKYACPSILKTTPMTTIGVEETTEASNVDLSPDDANRTDRGDVAVDLSGREIA